MVQLIHRIILWTLYGEKRGKNTKEKQKYNYACNPITSLSGVDTMNIAYLNEIFAIFLIYGRFNIIKNT